MMNANHPQPPEKLIEGCRAGNREAQYELYQRYAKAMLNTAFRIVHDQAEAEDVLQEAFIDAFKGLHRFRGESTFGAWLKRIVVNKSIDVVKKRRLQFSELDDEHLRLPEDRPADPDYPYTVAQVKEAVQSLPEGYRVVLTLFLFEGYAHDEIAEILGISVSTSKSQYHRAKSKVKEILIANEYV